MKKSYISWFRQLRAGMFITSLIREGRAALEQYYSEQRKGSL